MLRFVFCIRIKSEIMPWKSWNKIDLTQFGVTIWAKHNTHWQWNKLLKIMTLVWGMQMWKSWGKIMTMSLIQTHATNVTKHPQTQVIWGDIWKRTVEKSQTNATSVIMYPPMKAIWGHVWKPTMEKSQTNAASVIMHNLRQKI